MPDPRDPAHARAGGELVLPPVGLPGAARARSTRHRLRPPAVAPQRGARVRRPGPAGRLAHAREDHLGRPGAVGPRPRLLRVVRRAAQLLHGARLRPRRRGPHRPLLGAADVPRHRQGHPQVPRGLLAGAAARRRPRAAEAACSSTASCSGRTGARCPSRSATCSTRSRSMDRFGTDALRFYLLRDVAFGEDGSVSMEGVEQRYETELANDLGNLASRTTAWSTATATARCPQVDARPGAAPTSTAATAGRRRSMDASRSTRRSTRSGSACGG